MRSQQRNFHPLQEEPAFRQQSTHNFDNEGSPIPFNQNYEILQMPQEMHSYPQQVIQQPQAVIFPSVPADMMINMDPRDTRNPHLANIRGHSRSSRAQNQNQNQNQNTSNQVPDQSAGFSAGQAGIIEARIKNNFWWCYDVLVYMGTVFYGYLTAIFLFYYGLIFALLPGFFVSGFVAAIRAKKNMDSKTQNYAYIVFCVIFGWNLVYIGWIVATYIFDLAVDGYSRKSRVFIGNSILTLVIPLSLHGALVYFSRILRNMMKERESHLNNVEANQIAR